MLVVFAIFPQKVFTVVEHTRLCSWVMLAVSQVLVKTAFLFIKSDKANLKIFVLLF